MKKPEKAARIASILDDLFPMPDIPLEHEDVLFAWTVTGHYRYP